MDCHPSSQDASGDIHVSLDSSAPCGNSEARHGQRSSPSTGLCSRRKRYGYGPTTTLFSAVSLIGPAGDLLMIPRICECGRTLIMKSNKRWSRHGYRRIKGHDLCRKCNASLRDKVLSSLQNERWRRVNLNLTEPSRENCGAAHATF